MRKVIIFAVVLFFSLSGCTDHEEPQNINLDQDKSLKSILVVKEDDFIYRLISEKEEYKKDETVKLYAELEYIGDKESVTIYHAASPFYFPIYERTRGFEIGYVMNEPLVTTTLTRNESIRKEYIGGGGFDQNSDKKEYVDFIKDFWENGFPSGEYQVNGYANFYTEMDGKEKKDYLIKAQIEFIVH